MLEVIDDSLCENLPRISEQQLNHRQGNLSFTGVKNFTK